MWVAGRILIVFLVVIGVILVVAGTASLVRADSWTGQIEDIIIDSGIFIGGWVVGVALGVILLAVKIL